MDRPKFIILDDLIGNGISDIEWRKERLRKTISEIEGRVSIESIILPSGNTLTSIKSKIKKIENE